MSSAIRESNLAGGQPLKLFRFTRGTAEWFYTSADRPLVVDGNTYIPAAIAHSEIRDSAESNKADITITMPKDLPVVANWQPYPAGEAVAVTIMTQHYGEADWLVEWIGRVTSPQFDDAQLTLRSEPSATRARRGGKGRTCQRGCDLILYSQGDGMCNVDPADNALPATLSAVAGLALTSTSFLLLPSGRLAGGWFEWERADGLVERRSIKTHSGDTVTVEYGAGDLAPELSGTAYPGCAQSWEDCAYYDNTPNYGGHLYMPGRDYYDGNPVR